ncbi:hypothetical protein [Sporomusa sp. GT1]|uniref:hypothetical protein n=1 Tax=Sporomusa sp. GT1 TaxID=1534747 RepID=UPI00166DA745|nr:hypothetical protein [Sporomusa sp. GT1]
MSNPGVINLASLVTFDKLNFRVEDNIGEAIHIHFNNIRIDLTIEEFYVFCANITVILDQLIDVPDFSVSDIDPIFLSEMGSRLLDLERVTWDEVHLSELLIDTKGVFNLPVIKSLEKSRVFRALNGDTEENSNKKQTNYIGETNSQRLENNFNFVKSNEFNVNKAHITLYNNQNNIRDGQHRASCLYYLYGDIKIPVIRYWFKGNKYSINKYPLLHALCVWNYSKLRRVLALFYGQIRQKAKRVKCVVFKILFYLKR